MADSDGTPEKSTEKSPDTLNVIDGGNNNIASRASAGGRRSAGRGLSAGLIGLGVGLVLLSVTAGFIGGWLGARWHNTNLSTSAQRQVVSSESNLITRISNDVGPSVVSINVSGVNTQQQSLLGGAQNQESAGTGFIVSRDGVVVTNRHVVPAGTNKVTITLSDGTELTNVAVIGRTGQNDPLDIAFLRIKDAKGKNLKPVTLGDSSKMQVGDKVIAIGNALGQFQNTVTSGIISGYGREVQAGDENGSAGETLQDLFQTDAAINQGNSGGPLVNMNGEVIGINTAVAGNAQSIGFAIPSNDVSGIIKSVLTTGKLQRPYLGVRYISLTDAIAAENNLSVKRGAYIAPGDGSVIAGSPAEAAGLKSGDVITKVDSTEVTDKQSLSTILARMAVGQKITLTIVRDGKTQTINATLGAAPQN